MRFRDRYSLRRRDTGAFNRTDSLSIILDMVAENFSLDREAERAKEASGVGIN